MNGEAITDYNDSYRFSYQIVLELFDTTGNAIKEPNVGPAIDICVSTDATGTNC